MFKRLMVLIMFGLCPLGSLAQAKVPVSEMESSPLVEILIPEAKGLDGLELDWQTDTNPKLHAQVSEPIFAYKVEIGEYNGATAHLGYYSDSTIVTIINDQSRTFAKGTQIIIIGNTPVSMTTNWVLLIINGIQYAKHIHDRCFVYSTNVSQFVLFK